MRLDYDERSVRPTVFSQRIAPILPVLAIAAIGVSLSILAILYYQPRINPDRQEFFYIGYGLALVVILNAAFVLNSRLRNLRDRQIEDEQSPDHEATHEHNAELEYIERLEDRINTLVYINRQWEGKYASERIRRYDAETKLREQGVDPE